MDACREMDYGRIKKEKSMWEIGRIIRPMDMASIPPKPAIIKVTGPFNQG